jgi:hypothetical protein
MSAARRSELQAGPTPIEPCLERVASAEYFCSEVRDHGRCVPRQGGWPTLATRERAGKPYPASSFPHNRGSLFLGAERIVLFPFGWAAQAEMAACSGPSTQGWPGRFRRGAPRYCDFPRPRGMAVRHAQLNQPGDPARRVKATSDARLTDLDAALSCIIDAYRERRRDPATPLPAQGACTCGAHTHGAKGCRGRHDRLAAGVNHRTWGTRYRCHWRRKQHGIAPGAADGFAATGV